MTEEEAKSYTCSNHGDEKYLNVQGYSDIE